MSPSPEKDWQGRLLILDTGVMRELVLFHAVQVLRFIKLKRDLRFIKNQHSYQKCVQFMAGFRHKTTSPSVVAELHYWIRKTDSPGHLKLWNRVYDEFNNMNIAEEVVKLTDMDVNQVARFGPVDVSLIEIARRNAEHSPCILTVENALCGVCEKANIRALSIEEVTLTALR